MTAKHNEYYIKFSTVCFSSSVTKVTNSNLQIVCPDERVLIYCTTSEAGLVWNLPMEQNNLIAFFADDTTSPVQRLGSITLWRDSNQPLSSHIEIPYSPELDDTNFTCASGDESQSLRYKLAGTYSVIRYAKPDFLGVIKVLLSCNPLA